MPDVRVYAPGTAMLKVIAIAAQAVLLGFAGYSVLTSLWGWRNAAPSPRGARSTRFRVIVPAHDEGGVIDGVLDDLTAQDYPADRYRVVVIADRCTDDTAERAAAKATVAERDEGEGGKGEAIHWYLGREPVEDGALVVLDADNRVPPDLLGRFADEIEDGHEALQAYLDVTNPDGSMLATASALSYWASNRMVQLARRNLGWPADLSGTGMCITASALKASGGYGTGLTEDEELGVRLALAGIPVRWLHDLRIDDEKPEDLGVTVRQRARWVRGRREVRRRHLGALLRSGLRRRSAGLLDLAVRLVQPPRTVVSLLTAVLAVAALLIESDALLPWGVWAAAAAVQVLLPIPFLARDRVPARYLVRYPLLTLIAVIWLPVRVASRIGGRGWYHTPHRGTR